MNLKKEKLNTKFINEKIKRLISFIALKNDKISMFSTIKAKYAIKIIKKLLQIDAIRYDENKLKRIAKKNILKFYINFAKICNIHVRRKCLFISSLLFLLKSS